MIRLLALLLLLAGSAQAATLLPGGKTCFTDSSGFPLTGGRVTFFASNSATPKDTYQDQQQLILNTNPVILDSAGCATIYGIGIYRQLLANQLGTPIWDRVVASPAYPGISWGGVGAGIDQITIKAPEFRGIDGQVIGFLAGSSNTGAVTITTATVGPIPLLKDTSAGPIPLTGSELKPLNIVLAIYSSSANIFHLVSTVSFDAPTQVIFQSFTISGTWSKSANVTASSVVHLECWGGGGGGGSGAGDGDGGAGGGGYSDRWLLASVLSATETVTIGLGGAANTAGGNSTFGTRLTAYGGGGGGGGKAAGGGGGGETSAGSSVAGGVQIGGAGGGPWLVPGGAAATAGVNSMSGGSGAGYTSAALTVGKAGGGSYYGGGGGGGGTEDSAAAGAGGGSVWGGGGGGGSTHKFGSGGAGGLSIYGGAGGAGAIAGATGSAGVAPGGGGGGSGGHGARGECRATTYP